MGLDISVYERVELVTEVHAVEDSDGRICYEDKGHIKPYQEGCFQHNNGGIEPSKCYISTGEETGFRAGSYGYYGEWRRQLCLTATGMEIEVLWDSPEKYFDQPFWNLINFSDCEGVIGPTICAKLAEEFRTHRENVRPQLDEEWGQPKYDEWQEAFELAAAGGMVVFH